MTDIAKGEYPATAFLRLVASKGDAGASRTDLPFASRENDKARQEARRNGHVVYENRGAGSRWYVTNLGLAVLAALEAVNTGDDA